MKTIYSLKIKDVIELTDLGKSTIYNLIKEKKFPPPKKIGKRKSIWCKKEVLNWIKENGISVDEKENDDPVSDEKGWEIPKIEFNEIFFLLGSLRGFICSFENTLSEDKKIKLKDIDNKIKEIIYNN